MTLCIMTDLVIRSKHKLSPSTGLQHKFIPDSDITKLSAPDITKLNAPDIT